MKTKTQPKPNYNLRIVEQKTFDTLRKHAGKDRFVVLPVAKIVAETLSSERSIREALRCLERFGLMRRHFQPGGLTTYEMLVD